MAEFKSKHAIVSRSPYEVYMSFVDMRNFMAYLPEEHKDKVTADFDNLTISVQGFNIAITVSERRPYSKITYSDNGAPFHFTANLCFDAVSSEPSKTEFYIELEAELNFMMKMMIGGKLKDALDEMVQGIADMSEGKMPEGVDPSMFQNGNFKM